MKLLLLFKSGSQVEFDVLKYTVEYQGQTVTNLRWTTPGTDTHPQCKKLTWVDVSELVAVAEIRG
jgi:hypothetical protein